MRTYALPASWALGIIAVVLAGFRTDPYLEHVREIPPPHPYPGSTVLWIAAFITIQSAVAIAVLRPWSYHRSWGRAGVAATTSFGFLVLGIFTSMHAPPAHAIYLLWLLAAFIAMLGLFMHPVLHTARSSRGT